MLSDPVGRAAQRHREKHRQKDQQQFQMTSPVMAMPAIQTMASRIDEPEAATRSAVPNML
jgi:hypothetical protein